MRNWISLLLLLGAFNSSSQTMTNKDSLLQLLHTSKEDTTRIMLLLRIQKIFATVNFDSSLYYLNKAKSLAEKTAATAQHRWYINTGFSEYYYYNNDFKKALEYSASNLKLAQAAHNDVLLAKTYNNLAAINNHSGNYKLATAYALKCLALSEKTKDSASFPVRYLTVSASYYNLDQYDKSISYSKKAVEFGKKFGNTFAVMMGLNNLAASFSAKFKTDSAIYFLERQLEIAQREQDVVNITHALTNLCYNHFQNGNETGVQKYAAMLGAIDHAMPDNALIAEMHVAQSLQFIMQKKYTNARAELDSGITLALKDSIEDALGNLYRTYAKFHYLQGNIKEGEQYSYKYDSIISAANLKELNFYTEELETKYETEKKETQIQLQQATIRQKNIINYFLTGGALALMMISLLSYRNYRNRRKIQQHRINELETEKQLLATQSLLKGQEDERSRLAQDLHDGLGGLLSGVKLQLGAMKGNLILTEEHGRTFNNALNKLDESISEMRRVAHNMMPEALMKLGLQQALQDYCDSLSESQPFTINTEFYGLEQRMEASVEIVVYRIVQELVNNAVKHSGATTILAQVIRQNNNLSVTVEDNGKGFEKQQSDSTESAGLHNIRSRVHYLRGQMDIQSSPEKGTSIHIDCTITNNNNE